LLLLLTKTDILYLTNLNLKFKPVVKDQLFYGRFRYCVSFILQEVSCMRGDLNHEFITTMIGRRKEWREIAQERWSFANGGKKSNWSRRWR
jgi:hypothetical protein